jgi:hypothetical protein
MCPVERVRVRVRRLVRSLPLAGRGTLSLSLPLALHKHVKLTAAHEEQEVDPVFDENVPALHDLQTLLLVAP